MHGSKDIFGSIRGMGSDVLYLDQVCAVIGQSHALAHAFPIEPWLIFGDEERQRKNRDWDHEAL